MKKKIFAANWKMNKTIAEAESFAKEFVKLTPNPRHKVLIFAPFLSIQMLAKFFDKKKVFIGAQNLHQSEKGAFTGEISAEMLKEVGASAVIIGHSERRQFFAETNQTINEKIKTALANGFVVVFCVGETLEEREKGKTKIVLQRQITEGLEGIDRPQNVVVAYEPVWAIGTGKTATIKMIEETHTLIANETKKLFNKNVPVLYGGSVNEKNFEAIVQANGVDGALVGGASLSAEKFAQMVNKK